jgi:hypothetical protein
MKIIEIRCNMKLCVFGIVVLMVFSSAGMIEIATSGYQYPASADITVSVTTTCFDGPQEKWNKTFGGNDIDIGRSGCQTSDGGYLIVGDTESNGIGGKDIWVIKTDSDGNEIWDRTIGGRGDDFGFSVTQTSDEGFIITGWTYSYGRGDADVWVIKIDTNGVEEWNRTYGGTEYDIGVLIQQVTDGGYIIFGDTFSYGSGASDYWLIKTDSNGYEQWNKTFGGPEAEWAGSVQQTVDGGFILIGHAYPSRYSESNVWLLKTTLNGMVEWEKVFGGNGPDAGTSIQQTVDGGYIMTGFINNDAWLMKTDGVGNEQWSITFGGSSLDIGFSVQQIKDGGYIVTGYTVAQNGEGSSAWLINTDENGKIQWEKSFGKTQYDDYSYFVCEISDGGFILVGETSSYGAGKSDVWLIKISDGNNQCPNKPSCPNGPANGKFGEDYPYTSSSIDQDGDNVYLLFDWGDGTSSDWLGPYESGEECRASKVWTSRGNYEIKVKAKDIYGAESSWSDPLPITMPYTYKPPLIQFLDWLFQRFPNAFPLLRQLMGY